MTVMLFVTKKTKQGEQLWIATFFNWIGASSLINTSPFHFVLTNHCNFRNCILYPKHNILT